MQNPSSDKKAFAARLAKLIATHAYSQERIAECLGIQTSVLDSYLKGSSYPSDSLFLQLVELLHVSASWLQQGEIIEAKLKKVPVITLADAHQPSSAKSQRLLAVRNFELSDKAFAIEVINNSLMPLFPKDSLLIFDPEKSLAVNEFSIALLYHKPLKMVYLTHLIKDKKQQLYEKDFRRLESTPQKIKKGTAVCGLFAEASYT